MLQILFSKGSPQLIKRLQIFTSLHIVNRAQKGYFSRVVIEPAYKPALVERNKHVEAKLVTGDENSPKFSLLLPPPNVTGELHLGHALTCTLQDALVRWKTKQGCKTLWTPGMDHAGIATQVVVEKKLYKEKKLSRHDLGREHFLREIWQWKEEKGRSIKENLMKLGTCMDWDHEYFTMDDRQTSAVKEAFVRLFEKDLIYRDKALINWSCTLESAISDIEVENVEIDGPTAVEVPGYKNKIMFGRMADIAYKVHNSDEEIVISTTRPETLLGDVAVAVNTNDARYAHLANETTMLWHPIRQESIPLIFDSSVDPEFGTGAVKITPAHDRNDYDVAKRHKLPLVEVINSRGIIMENHGPFAGLPRYDARNKMMDYLTNQSLIRGIKPHSMVLPICSRSKDVVEFLLMPQWFIRCTEMAHRAKKSVEDGELRIIPDNFEKDWFRWLDNCHDWCISRQLWWGHRIPAFEVKSKNAVSWIAARSTEEACRKAKEIFGSGDFEISQDTDVLDTWFSSSLLPFSALGWPECTKGCQRYYPLNLMETGHDIIFFWVARMIMLGQELTGQLPFREILLHSIICDEHGRKMSKSLGNVIKPEHIIKGITLDNLIEETKLAHQHGLLSDAELKRSIVSQRKAYPHGIPECGTDALRFTLCSTNVKNYSLNFNIQECHSNKLFFNKIWQATRYTLMCKEKFDTNGKSLDKRNLLEFDRWILSKLGNTIVSFKNAMDEYNFHLAAAAWKTFFYNNLCDVYLETTKVHMKAETQQIARNQCAVLQHCLSIGLNHLEVFTPFIATELLSHLPSPETKFHESEWIDRDLESTIEQLLEICQSIRQAKNEHNPPIARKHNPVVHIYSKSDQLRELIQRQLSCVQQLTLSNGVQLYDDERSFDGRKMTAKSTASHLCSFGLTTNLSEELKQSAPESGEISGHTKKMRKLESELEKLVNTVSREGYKKFASEEVQKKHLEKINNLRLQIENMRKMDVRSVV
ncbi:valine--tRNA ligase [Toxorhynchites rutilus septentrionalis]|uniref:valine--tRNA ligase n=1 Tax=Toxorhynchites rutilus septentrionalis TaxID=329112 RepID=UPI00247A2CA4|nr:valine--tRNA ligase [Toxorhynchites rutilus septentrionalis]